MHQYLNITAINLCLIGCTSLSSINVNFINWTPNCTTDWVLNVKNTSACIFTCPSELPIIRGNSYIPSAWSIKRKYSSRLCFTALLDNSTILLLYNGTSSAVLLYYDKNDTDLVFFEPNVTKITLNKGLFVKFRNNKTTFSKDSSNYYYFKMSGKIAATGNTNSLINYSNLTSGCYLGLFSKCSSLITAPELPATLLANYCYSHMFLRLYKFKQSA